MSDADNVTLREHVDKIFALNNLALDKAFALNNVALEKAFSLNQVAIDKTEKIIDTKLQAITKDVDNLSHFQSRLIGIVIGASFMSSIVTALALIVLRMIIK